MSVVLQVFDHKPKHWTNTNVDPMMAPEEKSEDHQSYDSSPSGNHECLFKISLKSRLTDFATSRAAQLARLKIKPNI